MRETHRKVARTVSNVLALMDEDPDFTYAMSSAQQYAWMEQEHPDLFARMLQRIKEGWIGNGVLDRFLEDESLFGEFLRTPVSEGGVEPLVVGPPHVVVEVGA